MHPQNHPRTEAEAFLKLGEERGGDEEFMSFVFFDKGQEEASEGRDGSGKLRLLFIGGGKWRNLGVKKKKRWRLKLKYSAGSQTRLSKWQTRGALFIRRLAWLRYD